MPHPHFADNPAASIEMEIQALLLQFQGSDLAADALVKKYSKEKLKLVEFEVIATFLLRCGFAATLTDFIRKKLDDGSKIPWGHFVEAISLATKGIEPEIRKALVEGAEEQRAVPEMARSHALDESYPDIPKERKTRKQKFHSRLEEKKVQYIQEIEILRSQGLHQEEERLIQMLSKLFPGDLDIYYLRSDLRMRQAQDFIAKRPLSREPKKVFLPMFEKKDPESEAILQEIEKAMARELAQDDQLADDFAIAHMNWDNYEAALHMLEKSPDSPTRDWLKAELLFRCRRFGELMDELLILEEKYAVYPETVFAVHYLRAQALWGLNQKQTAIEILEGMTEARPDYRAAVSLLREWKEDFP